MIKFIQYLSLDYSVAELEIFFTWRCILARDGHVVAFTKHSYTIHKQQCSVMAINAGRDETGSCISNTGNNDNPSFSSNYASRMDHWAFLQ